MKLKKVISSAIISTLVLSQLNVISFANYRNEYKGVLQKETDGKVYGEYYVPSSPENIIWGRLPNKNSESVLTVPSGSTVTFDTISHEGILEDQGRNPIEYFEKYGIAENNILDDAKVIANSNLDHDFDKDGPHIVTGPVYIEGAMPGDVLKVEIINLEPRVPYGVISNRHYKGALDGEFPENAGRQDGANAENPELYNNVSIFTLIKEIDGVWYGYFDNNGKEIKFPIKPFFGLMGVTPNTDENWSSIPPAHIGGNIDINELGIGSTLYLPVEVEGGLFYVGDPHFVQGDGEVALTALEGSLRGTVKLTILKESSVEVPRQGDAFTHPFAETEEYWIPIGLDKDLNLAMKQAVRESIDFISKQLGIDRALAYAYLSAATDYEVSQVVDRVKGIHGLISKVDFINLVDISLKTENSTIKVNALNDKFYVPARDVLQSLGAEISLSDNLQTASIKINNKEIIIKADSNKYVVNGNSIHTESSPIMVNNILMLPVSSLSEIFGASVTWSTVTNKIIGNVIILY